MCTHVLSKVQQVACLVDGGAYSLTMMMVIWLIKVGRCTEIALIQHIPLIIHRFTSTIGNEFSCTYYFYFKL